MNLNRNLSISLFSILLIATGCNNDAWTRGQPPSVETMVTRAKSTLSENINARKSKRPEISQVAENIEVSLLKAYELSKGPQRSDILAPLLKSQQDLLSLEGKLSLGSRPAYGELSKQLQEFIRKVQDGEQVSNAGLGLYFSRVLLFLSDELLVSAPS